jgi:hypothetical protein
MENIAMPGAADELARLARLREEGVLTDTEFETLKQHAIRTTTSQPNADGLTPTAPVTTVVVERPEAHTARNWVIAGLSLVAAAALAVGGVLLVQQRDNEREDRAKAEAEAAEEAEEAERIVAADATVCDAVNVSAPTWAQWTEQVGTRFERLQAGDYILNAPASTRQEMVNAMTEFSGVFTDMHEIAGSDQMRKRLLDIVTAMAAVSTEVMYPSPSGSFELVDAQDNLRNKMNILYQAC